MADLLSTNVTVISAYRTGGTAAKMRLTKRVRWTATTAGSVANKLLASAFGFRVIEQCSNVFYDGGTKALWPAVPSPNGDYVTLIDPNQAVDASRSLPADLATGASNAYISITGYD